MERPQTPSADIAGYMVVLLGAAGWAVSCFLPLYRIADIQSARITLYRQVSFGSFGIRLGGALYLFGGIVAIGVFSSIGWHGHRHRPGLFSPVPWSRGPWYRSVSWLRWERAFPSSTTAWSSGWATGVCGRAWSVWWRGRPWWSCPRGRYQPRRAATISRPTLPSSPEGASGLGASRGRDRVRRRRRRFQAIRSGHRYPDRPAGCRSRGPPPTRRSLRLLRGCRSL